MLLFVFVIAAAIFVAYAIYSNYSKTPGDSSIAMRIWLSVIAAVASVGAALATFFGSSSAIP